MIITKHGKNLLTNSPFTNFALTANTFSTIQTLTLKANTTYVLSTDLTNATFNVFDNFNNVLALTSNSFTTGIFTTITIQIETSNPTGNYSFVVQLEEGSTATAYEAPYKFEINLPTTIQSGEFVEEHGGVYYKHHEWYEDAGGNPYETITFSNGQGTLSEPALPEPLVVINTADGYPLMAEMVSPSGNNKAITLFNPAYDSFTTTNATTTAFTLANPALETDSMSVYLNNTLTTSGFTKTITEVTFDNPVASGSAVTILSRTLNNISPTCEVHYKLDTPYDAEIKLPSTNTQMLHLDDAEYSTTSTASAVTKNFRFVQSTDHLITSVDTYISVWNATTSAITTVGVNVDGGADTTATTSSATETILTVKGISVPSTAGIHTINLSLSTSNASYAAYTKLWEVYQQ